MEAETTIQGTLIGCVERSYGAFTDGQGREVQGGTTRRVFLAGAFDSRPAEVKVKDPKLFESIRACGQWAEVRLTCQAFARRSELELTALQLHKVEAKAS